MGEEWRQKTYYDKRVLIETDRVLNPQGADNLLCITAAQAEMMRNLCAYLRRRSTYVSTYAEGYYLAPTEEEWDDILEIVAELEETLMGCEAITTLLTDMLAAMQCVCQATRDIANSVTLMSPVIEDYIDDGTLIPVDIYGPDTAVSTKRCAIAQLTYQQMYDVLTIYLQPFQETSVDVMLGIILAGIVVTVGVGAVAIPAAVIVAVLLGLADMVVEGSLTAVRNAISSNKDELICGLYRGLQTDYAAAQAEAHVIFAGIGVLTLADRIILGQLCAPWAIWLAATAWDNATVWALSNVDAGACDDCLEEEGDDWWALRIPIEDGLVEFDHTDPGPEWLYGCYQYALPAGVTMHGIIWRYQKKTGTCELKRMGEHGTCVTGGELWGNHSSPGEDPGRFFSVNPLGIDADQCKAQLAPYATNQEDLYIYDAEETINATWDMGWNCVGTCEVVVEWLIFAGSPP